MYPRLDDRNGHITQGNNVLKDIANDENVHFIDNDQSMRNVNGAIMTASSYTHVCVSVRLVVVFCFCIYLRHFVFLFEQVQSCMLTC
jgi:hypothetical protein